MGLEGGGLGGRGCGAGGGDGALRGCDGVRTELLVGGVCAGSAGGPSGGDEFTDPGWGARGLAERGCRGGEYSAGGRATARHAVQLERARGVQDQAGGAAGGGGPTCGSGG